MPGMKNAGFEEAVPRRASLRVLIVDDEVCIADLMAEMLRLLGYSPRRCLAAASALEVLKTENFDVVLSDFQMPRMTGEEFYAEAIRIAPDLTHRFIFLSGDLTGETRKFLARTSLPHMEKPFTLAALQSAIASIWERHQPALTP